MRFRGWLLILALVVGAGVVLSGSSVLRGTPEQAVMGASKSELTAAIRAVDERLARSEIEAATVRAPVSTPASAWTASHSSSTSMSTSDPATARSVAHASARAGADRNADAATLDAFDRTAGPGVLRARAARILECIDSLERAGESAWRGALPGLRAAVADLEYRTDLAALATIDSIVALDAHIHVWLQEMARQIESMIEVGEKAAHDRGMLNDTRVAHARLEQRFMALRQDGADSDGMLRRALAEELTDLRRTVRALVRATRHHPADAPA